MRLLTFSFKNSGGGSIVKLIELIEGLSNRGWEVDYISPTDYTPINKVNHHSIKTTTHFQGLLYLVQVCIISLYIIFLKKHKPDRIVAFSLLEGFVGLLISFLSKNSKIIVSLHGDWYTGVELFSWNPFIKWLYINLFLIIEKVVFKYSDCILFVSNENYDRIKKRSSIHKNKVHVVYNNINTPRAIDLINIDGISFKEKIIIGYVGRLVKSKGIKYLIEAFKQFHAINNNSLLVIVGGGPDENLFKNLCKNLCIEQDVLFTGYLDNPFSYIKSFDLMVLPSLHEGFNLSILEALSVDKIVIASRVGGNAEALKYDELLFNPYSVEEIVDKISHIFSDKSIYENALQLCKSRKDVFSFDWVNNMESIILNAGKTKILR